MDMLGGPPLSFVVHRSSLAVKDHLPRQMVSYFRNGMTGRHGCAGLGPPIRGRYRQAVHQAGRPACGPYGIAMGRWNFVHQAGRPACGPTASQRVIGFSSTVLFTLHFAA